MTLNQSILQSIGATPLVQIQKIVSPEQATLFAKRQLKPVWLEEAVIRQNLEREYRPGEEIAP